MNRLGQMTATIRTGYSPNGRLHKPSGKKLLERLFTCGEQMFASYSLRSARRPVLLENVNILPGIRGLLQNTFLPFK